MNRSLLAALVPLVAACCTIARPVSPNTLAAPGAVPRVWVTLSDHSTVLVSAPRLAGDTVVGFVEGVEEHFLLSQALGVATHQVSKPRTAALAVFGGVVLAGLIAYAVEPHGTCFTPGGPLPCANGHLVP